MKKTILLFLVTMFAFPCLALAEIDTDLRFKFGRAAGSDKIEFENAVGHDSNKNGTNAQVEIVLGPQRDSIASFIMAIGFFHRQHSVEIQDLSVPLKVDYSVAGMNIAPGARLRINDTLNAEVKLEVGLGNAGQVTLNSPGINWNATKKGNYRSISLVWGGYYLFKSSSIRVGVEVGMQTFNGDFEIWSNSGKWSSANVTGEGGMANIVCGFQF
jgi:hypothetical protein